MDKCFAYHECFRNGIRVNSCDILSRRAFIQTYRNGCTFNNCPFYKENRDQIHSDIGLYPMSRRQKAEREMYYRLNYKGVPNVHKIR